MRALATVLVLLAGSLAGCGGDVTRTNDDSCAASSSSCAPAVDAGTDSAGNAVVPDAAAADAEVPIHHRPTPAQCPTARGPGPSGQPYGSGMASTCTTDSQCTSGADGRCFPFEGLVGPGGCSYDQCFTDSDCPSGTPCQCRSSPSDNTANACAPGGNCVLDSDCGKGGYCSPSEGCFGLPAYYCHTASDACINDTDCAPTDPGEGCQIPAICIYDGQALHWACNQQRCCPP